LPLIPKLRFGLVGLYLRLANQWQSMESETAESWLTRTMGATAYEILWKPMLIGKFGDLYRNVTMAWFWARIHTRTVKLGTYRGGFQRFLDAFAEKLTQLGVTIKLNTPVQAVVQAEGKLQIQTQTDSAIYDSVISTSSPAAMIKLAPELPTEYVQKLSSLQNMSAVVLVLAIDRQFMTDGTYWLNLPATSPDKSKSEFPFLALVEHTNYLDAAHYGGDHLLYCGDYITPDHEYMKLSDDELAERFIAALPKLRPDFKREWIRQQWVFRAPYAQPIPTVNHSRNVPSLATGIPGLYLASMSHIYPWDRGTNYAVMLGHQVADRVMNEVKS
jgi:protoporphyrinogen oxidase